MTLGISCDCCGVEDMGGGGWFKSGSSKVCHECRMKQIADAEEERERIADEQMQIAEESEDKGLPPECKNGQWSHCWGCFYYAGVMKNECPKNGGTEKYEPSDGLKGGIREFVPYTLANCPAFKIPDTDPNKELCYKTPSGDLKWGKDLQGERVPDLDRMRLGSAREEREYFTRMEVRKVERGEKVMKIDAPLKDRPKKRIYSFIKG